MTPGDLAAHYTRFRVSERLLLTGHSHQAWPDVAFDGQVQAWNDAAALVDEKWGRAAEQADRVRRGFARLLGAAPDEVALGQNTHELVLRFLSALPLRERPRLVTTDGEFHSIRRQLDRLAEDGRLEIVKVPADPPDAIADRLAGAVNGRTAAVLASSVLFGNAAIVPGLGSVAVACRAQGTELLVDAYHHLNVVPFSLRAEGLEEAFVVGGGYKYCQLGEGNCFLRVPPHARDYRPVITGWYGEFAHLTDRSSGRVAYAEGPDRWAGATYDPTSHYRAARVFDFFEQQGLTPERLRAISEHQLRLLAGGFDALGKDAGVIARDRSLPLERIGGFLALRSPRAEAICAGLRARGVLADFRGDQLRLGPAPYLADEQIERAIAELGRVAEAQRGA
ncbi:MAG TPA: kynureninase [Candidatus Binatia bacterium]|nr:kynureninase [Candidatus Binatia bacterium]